MKNAIYLESFEYFNDDSFEKNVKKSMKQLMNDNCLIEENVEIVVSRDSKDMGMTVNGLYFTVSIRDYQIFCNEKFISQLSCYKSNKNDYYLISSN